MQDEIQEAHRLQDLNTEHAKRAHDVNRQTKAEFAKAAIESANVAMRTLMLVNGGAVVALLAFVGTLQAKSSGKVEVLVNPLFAFALGAGFAVATAMLAYFVNMLDYKIVNSVRHTWKHPYVEDEAKVPRLLWWRNRIHVVAILIAFSSLVAFFVGVSTVASAISELGV